MTRTSSRVLEKLCTGIIKPKVSVLCHFLFFAPIANISQDDLLCKSDE